MEKITVAALVERDLTGKVICFPTDTVYGIGCLAGDEVAIGKIFALKHRDFRKPLALLIGPADLATLTAGLTGAQQALLAASWPGAVTFILKKPPHLPASLTQGAPTIGLRMPDSPVAQKLIARFGPLATTSANLSGEAPAQTLGEICARFAEGIDYLVIDPEQLSGVPSAIYDLTTDAIKRIR